MINRVIEFYANRSYLQNYFMVHPVSTLTVSNGMGMFNNQTGNQMHQVMSSQWATEIDILPRILISRYTA